MTSYEIKRIKFEPDSVSTLVKTDTRLKKLACSLYPDFK